MLWRAVSMAVGMAGFVAVASAGPLTPPIGPVSSTYKSMVEVEPRSIINDANTPGTAAARFRITQSGSYYLDRSWAFRAGRFRASRAS